MKKVIKISAALMLTAVSLSSCLKDNSVELSPEKGTNVIEWANPAQRADNTSSIALYTISYPLGAKATKTMTVSYSGPESKAPEDITVNFALADTSVIGDYNRELDESFELMPTNAYSISASSVVIKKGANKATFDITVDPDKFDLARAFVIPLKITSVSSGIISGNFNTILLNVGAKNAYDGVYQFTTTAATSFQPNKNVQVKLITASANSVSISPGLLGTYSNSVSYTIDPATNQVTVTCTSLGVQMPQDTRSKYDPATKTFKVYWKRGSGTAKFEETIVYTGVR